MRGTTYKERYEGTKGIGANMTRAVRAAHQASIDPKGTQVALGLADADRIMKAKQHKLMLKQAIARKKGNM